MPTNVKPETTSTPFSPEEIAAALAAASEPDDADDPIDWQQGIKGMVLLLAVAFDIYNQSKK